MATLRLPPLRPYQEAFLRETARDAVCYSCTQVGKTDVCACWIVAEAWQHPRTIWGWYAPTEKQLKQGFAAVLALVASAGILAGKTESPGDREIRLVNGARIAFGSWHEPETLRGPTIHGGVVDEAGLLTQRAYGIISSRRSATLGSIRWIGNPGLTTGPFRVLCSQGEDPSRDASRVATYRWTWRDLANAHPCACDLPELAPDAPPEPWLHEPSCGRGTYVRFIANEKETLPEMEFFRLYEATWTADEDAVFRADMVERKTHGEPLDGPEAGESYVIGVDVGQMNDYLVASIWGRESRRLGAQERWRGLPSHESEQRLKALARRWNHALVWVETNGPGQPLLDGLRSLGVSAYGWTTTAQSKGPAVLSFAREVNDPESDLSLAPLPPLQDELRAFRYTRLPAGGYRYSAPHGLHDDCVMAALVGHQAISGPPAAAVAIEGTEARFASPRRGGAFA